MQEQQRRLDAFTPAYERLVTVVVHNVQYPSDYHEWHRDELQEFRHNRYAISETLEDAAGKHVLLLPLYVCVFSKGGNTHTLSSRKCLLRTP